MATHLGFIQTQQHRESKQISVWVVRGTEYTSQLLVKPRFSQQVQQQVVRYDNAHSKSLIECFFRCARSIDDSLCTIHVLLQCDAVPSIKVAVSVAVRASLEFIESGRRHAPLSNGILKLPWPAAAYLGCEKSLH